MPYGTSLCRGVYNKGGTNIICSGACEIDAVTKLPQKIKVADPNGRVFNQVVKYEWILKYFPKCMQVGHKFHVKEENKDKGMTRLVQKWQGKLLKIVGIGPSKNNSDPISQQP